MRAGRSGRRSRRSVLYRCVIAALRPVVALLFAVRVHGRLPAEGPLLVAANHVSYLDPVVLAVVLHRAGHDARFLTVAEVFRRPLVGAALRAGRFIPVTDRLWQRATAARAAAEGLRAGDTVVIYPEGTIPTDQPLEARPGVAWLARRTGAPVVAVGTAGMHRVSGRGGWLRRRRAAVVVGPVLHLDPDGSAADDPGHAADVLTVVRALVPAAEALVGSSARGRARGARRAPGR